MFLKPGGGGGLEGLDVWVGMYIEILFGKQLQKPYFKI